MSHTLETAIAFPLVLTSILLLLSAGPVMYEKTAQAAEFHVSSIAASINSSSIYGRKTLVYENESYEIICTSPERMHFLVRAIDDSAKIIIEGVTAP